MSMTPFDWAFVTCAIVFFYATTGVFISFARGHRGLLRSFGIVMLSLAIPLVIVLVNYIIVGQELWVIALLLLILFYLLLELLLDFVFHVEFRRRTVTHVPYIVIYYATSFSFVGIAFHLDEMLGWLVTISFWTALAGLVYSYRSRMKRA